MLAALLELVPHLASCGRASRRVAPRVVRRGTVDKVDPAHVEALFATEAESDSAERGYLDVAGFERVFQSLRLLTGGPGGDSDYAKNQQLSRVSRWFAEWSLLSFCTEPSWFCRQLMLRLFKLFDTDR